MPFVNYNCHLDNKSCQNDFHHFSHLSNIGHTTIYTKDNMQMFIKKFYILIYNIR